MGEQRINEFVMKHEFRGSSSFLVRDECEVFRARSLARLVKAGGFRMTYSEATASRTHDRIFPQGSSVKVALFGENCSPLVPFTFRADEIILAVEQFWGRAVQASCNSQEFRALLICVDVGAGVSPVLAQISNCNHGTMTAAPSMESLFTADKASLA
jgi:hypothetical protein